MLILTGKAFLKDAYAKRKTTQALPKQRKEEELKRKEQNVHKGLEVEISLVQLKNLKTGVAGVQRATKEGKVPDEAGNAGSSARQCVALKALLRICLPESTGKSLKGFKQESDNI